MRIPITLNPGALPPRKAYASDACFDLHANEELTIHPGNQATVHTGAHIGIPDGWEGQVRTRSGHATRGLQVVNSPGTIDAGYTGEVCVIIRNDGNYPYPIRHGDRVAQLAIKEVPHVVFDVVDELDATTRGDRGFGSTGTRQAVTVR